MYDPIRSSFVNGMPTKAHKVDLPAVMRHINRRSENDRMAMRKASDRLYGCCYMKVVELKQRPNFISTMEQDVEAEARVLCRWQYTHLCKQGVQL
jgi:hypothetical protein